MVKVKLLCDRVSARASWSAGAIVNLDRKEALALIKSGSAERISRDEPEVETASIGPPSNAKRPMGAPRIDKETT